MLSVNDFLNWIVLSGGAVSIASWIFERIPWFQAQLADVKEWIFFGISSLLAIGAHLVLVYLPQSALDVIAPYFLMIGAIFSTVVIAKMFHNVDKS